MLHRRGRVGASLLCWLTTSLCSCDPFHATFDEIEGARAYRARELKDAPSSPTRLRVMNYNVKFGGGRLDFFFDCHGQRVLMKRSEVITNLEALVLKIQQVDPDVLVVQEIDINSKRAAFVDQMQ